jgi:hypothetical protein
MADLEPEGGVKVKKASNEIWVEKVTIVTLDFLTP